MFDSVTSMVMKGALDSLSLRQRVIADNIANVNTPGFRAGRVQFEDELAKAVRAGRTEPVEPTVSRSLEPTRLDGNNVNLDTETLSNVDTNLRYQVAVRSIDGHFTAMRTAMRSN